MDTLTDTLLGSGQTDPDPPVRTLRAGPVTLDYMGGFLRTWRVGGREVLRLVNFAVRDRNWGTVPFELEEETVEAGDDGFRITLRAHFRADGIDYAADIRFAGGADGTVQCEFEGEALSAFERNRIGFTVLHPLEGFAGSRIELEHTDGTHESAPVPSQVSGRQPFHNIRALAWEAAGARARLEFSGEVFEMEDQRNWTDASFKTYGTPLDLPFPVAVAAGERMQQRVTFRLERMPVAAGRVPSRRVVELQVGGARRPWPALGVAQPHEREVVSAWQWELLRALQLAHYRCELDLTDGTWQPKLEAATIEANALGAGLELVVFLRDASEAEPLLAWLRQHPLKRLRVLVLGREQKVTPPALLATVVEPLRQACPGARIGAGTDAFFAELNRERVNREGIDFLSYSINPQVHAFDRCSLVETLEAQGHTVATARGFAAGADVAISPLTFRMRWNPNATAREAANEVVDLRQLSLFGAGWALGSLASLAAAGASAITCFESVGPRGLMQVSAPRSIRGFPASAGAVYPLYFTFLELAGAEDFVPVQVSARESVSALIVSRGECDRLVAANHTPEPVSLRLPAGFEPRFRRLIDVAQSRRLLQSPRQHAVITEAWTGQVLQLPPFALVALDRALPPHPTA